LQENTVISSNEMKKKDIPHYIFPLKYYANGTTPAVDKAIFL
jgi:hypothetical protein